MPTPPDLLAARLAPQLQAIVARRRDDLIGSVAGVVARRLLALAYPHFVAAVPVLMRDLLDAVSAEFGKLTLDDLLGYLSRQKQDEGRS